MAPNPRGAGGPDYQNTPRFSCIEPNGHLSADGCLCIVQNILRLSDTTDDLGDAPFSSPNYPPTFSAALIGRTLIRHALRGFPLDTW